MASSARVEYYQLDDGTFSTDKSNAKRADPGDIVIAWRKQTSIIPATFAVGTALHETNYATNEHDVENDANGNVTDGIFQLMRSEAVKASYPLADLFDLDDSATVFATLMEANYQKLLDASGLDEQTALSKGLLGYLAWSHNTGLAHKDGKVNALESIQQSGLDWEAWKARNNYDWGVKMGAYGDDCISGGPDWKSDYDPSSSGGGDSSNPYDVTPTVDAGIKSKLRLLLALAIIVIVASKLISPRSRILGII